MGHRGMGPTRTETGFDRWSLRFCRFRLYPSPLMAPVQETSEPSIKSASEQRVVGPAENRRQVAPSFPSPVLVVVHGVHPKAEACR